MSHNLEMTMKTLLKIKLNDFSRASLLLFLALLTSCSSWVHQRTYIEQMEREDERFFRPGEHFAVVVGDSGQRYRSSEEIQARTPATQRSERMSLYQRSAEEELRLRVNGLSAEEYQAFQVHRPYLSSIGEKIYYLELSHSERQEYMRLRGHNPSAIAVAHAQNNREIAAFQRQSPERIHHMASRSPASGHTSSMGLSLNETRSTSSGALSVGMTKNQVLGLWGEPLSIDYAGNPRYENERWRYRIAGQTREVFFEAGRVDGWYFE